MQKFLVMLLSALLIVLPAIAQQPQCPTCPISAVNVKYVQGAGPGYAPTKGSGLTLNLAAGRVRCQNTMTNYAGGTLTMTNSTTNYVFLDSTASCAPTSNTTGYVSSSIPVATVVASGGVITTITDDRTFGIGTPVEGQEAVRSFGTTFGSNAAGSPVAALDTVYFTVPYACTITAWNMTATPAGTATIDIWKIASGTAVPTVTNTITAAALPAISTGTAKHSTSVGTWTTSVAANDIVAISLTAVTTSTYVEIDIQCNE